MSVVNKIIVMAGHRGDTEYELLKEEERKNAEYELLVSFCKGEIGNSVILYYDDNKVLNNIKKYLPRYIFRHILSFKGMDWLYHSQSPHLMKGYRKRNLLIRTLCRTARFNRLTKVNFENISVGTFCTFDLLMNDCWYNPSWSPIQRKEFCRLMGKAYANGTRGYQNEWLYAQDINTNSIIKTSDTGEEKINLRNKIINYCNNNNNRDKLPLPLKIMFKVGIHITGNWPKDNNNNYDLTADILWPENRADVHNFFRKVPSIHDFEYYGW